MMFLAFSPFGRASTLWRSAWDAMAYLLRHHESDKAGCINAACLRRYLPPFTSSAIADSVSCS